MIALDSITGATRLLAGGLALVVIAGAFVAGCEYGQDRVTAEWNEAKLAQEERYRAALDEKVQENKRLEAEANAREANLSGFLAAERAETERLKAALARSQLVTRPEPTDANPRPDSRLSDAWRLCWNAHWTGNPADRAACQAAGQPLPDAGGR